MQRKSKPPPVPARRPAPQPVKRVPAPTPPRRAPVRHQGR
jgi:hypothetical protein